MLCYVLFLHVCHLPLFSTDLKNSKTEKVPERESIVINSISGKTPEFNYLVHFLSPAPPKARDGRYCNAPRLSVCLSVCPSIMFSLRTVTRERITVFSRNFAGTCTMSWGCAVVVFDIDVILFEFFMDFFINNKREGCKKNLKIFFLSFHF